MLQVSSNVYGYHPIKIHTHSLSLSRVIMVNLSLISFSRLWYVWFESVGVLACLHVEVGLVTVDIGCLMGHFIHHTIVQTH